jgi:hypothetical protein
VKLDSGRFGRSWNNRLDSLAENAPRLLGKCRSTFPFVQIDRSLGSGSRPDDVAGGAQNRRQRQTCVAVIDQRVSPFGQGDSSFGLPPGLVVITLAGKELRTQHAPCHRRLQRVAGETLTFRT